MPESKPQSTEIQDEINRLVQEVQRLREEQPETRKSSEVTPIVEPGPTVLVFQDKHVEQIKNYILEGKILWVFNDLRWQKIPLTVLDVPATVKANEDLGVDFQVPE